MGKFSNPRKLQSLQDMQDELNRLDALVPEHTDREVPAEATEEPLTAPAETPEADISVSAAAPEEIPTESNTAEPADWRNDTAALSSEIMALISDAAHSDSDRPEEHAAEAEDLPAAEENKDWRNDTAALSSEIMSLINDTEASAAPVQEKPVKKAAPAKPKDPKARNRKIMLISLCSVVAVLLLSIIGTMVYLFTTDPNGGKILNNVTVAGINIGNMSKSEARAAIKAATDNTFTQKDMVINFPDIQMCLSPADTGAKLDVNKLVNEAYDYGRSGTEAEREQALASSINSEHPIAMLPYLTLNTEYIRQQLEDYSKSFNSVYSASSAGLDGETPIVNGAEEGYTGEVEDRNLVIYTGTPGRYIDFDKVYDRILDAYSFNQFELTVEMDEQETIPDAIDLDALYNQFYSEVSDAVIDPETFEVTMEVYGYEFDLEQAKTLLENAKYGDTITLPMKVTKPEFFGGTYRDTYFRDVLCEYQTEHTKDEKRNTNLTLACAAINGMVLAPGEEFDYNTVVGERTRDKGYQPAAAYSSGKTVQDIGGGVCQVSSTIYYCCLISDLEIINRMPHSYVSSYMPMGMDATVNWGGPEFTFKNNTNYPIRIETWVADGYVHCKLLGTDEKDYYIEMEYEVIGEAGPEIIYEEYPENNPEGYRDGQVIQTPYKGYWVNTYKNKYSKATGELISRDFDKMSAYKKLDKIIDAIVKAPPPTHAPAPAPEPAA